MRSPIDEVNSRGADGDACVSLTLPSRVESIRPAAAFIVESARTMQVPSASESLFEGAVVEALNNAVKHGRAGEGSDASIRCEVERADNHLLVRIFDCGAGFVLPGPAGLEWSPAVVSSVPESGFGLHIIRAVFPVVRTVARPGMFGVEMALPVTARPE